MVPDPIIKAENQLKGRSPTLVVWILLLEAMRQGVWWLLCEVQVRWFLSILLYGATL